MTDSVSFIYSDKYYLDWPGHIFPSEKFHLIYEQLIAERVISANEIAPYGARPKKVVPLGITPRPATEDEVALVHSPGYLALLRKIAAQNPLLGLSGFEVPVSR